MKHWGLLFLAVASFGCSGQPDPDPRAEEPPGFSPCSVNERVAELVHSLCPVDGSFPYGTTLHGRFSGLSDGSVSFSTDTADVWEFDYSVDSRLLSLGVDWMSLAISSSEEITVRVNQACADADEHWFEVAAGESLLVAGGTAIYAAPSDGAWTVGRSPRQDILKSQCAEELRVCECWESCFAIPIGFKYQGSFVAELYSAERTQQHGYQVLAFEAWRGVGESSCPDAAEEEGRWLILRQ